MAKAHGLRRAGLPDPAERILMLVPHEVDVDPRVRWAVRLCEEFCATDVVGIRGRSDRPARRIEGAARIEEIPLIPPQSFGRWRHIAAALASRSNAVGEFVRRRERDIREAAAPGSKRGPARLPIRLQIAAVLRFLVGHTLQRRIGESLYRHARGTCLRPNAILCHDLIALEAGVRLKRLFRCGLIYDSHESWPEEDVCALPWEMRRVARREARLLRDVDEVITVTPQLAARLQERYSLQNVRVVPNVEPLQKLAVPSCDRPTSLPIKVLVQGRVCIDRGFHRLLSSWRNVDPGVAVLWVRAPQNDYLAALERQFADLVESGRLAFLPAVREDALVSAAAEADVGVIPYPPQHANYEVACPNKFSQYMQAGLAVVSTELPFVRDAIARFDCGRIFDLQNERSLPGVIGRLADDLAGLQRLKSNSRLAARREFCWETLSRPYREALGRFFEGRRTAAVPRAA